MHILQGNPATPEQRAADIRHIIDLLQDDKHKNYHLGLFTGADSKNDIYKVSFWEIKAEHTLLLENLATGERDVKNTEATLTDWFRELFERFWKSKGMITDKGEVIEKLTGFADDAERLAKAPAMS
jgi:hypothetical protein